MKVKLRTNDPTARSRLSSLDCLRGIAALAVVVYHFGWRATELFPQLGTPLAVVAYGHYGVQLFFVISGFVIFMSLQRTTVVRFAKSRFIRLYPIYWVCLALTFFVVLLFGLPGREVSWQAALFNLTMVQSYFGVPHVDGAYWTLAAEIAFYLQVAVLFAAGLLKPVRVITTLYVWLVLAVLAMFSARLWASEATTALFSIVAQSLAWLPMFIAGMALFLIWKGDRRIRTLAIPVAVIFVMFVRDIELGIAVSIVMLATAWAVWGRGFGAARKPLLFLGEISYALYLIHQNIGYVGLRWLDSLGWSQQAGIVVMLLVVVAIATVLTYMVDKPLRRWLRKRMLPSRVPELVAP